MPPDPIDTPKGPRGRRAGAMALVMGLAALTAQATESDLVHNIQRYCAVCWRNAQLDPGLWDDCTQEVCCRLLTKARAGELDLNLVLADDTPERRELIRAIDMVRKRVQRARRHVVLDDQHTPGPDLDRRARDRQELGEILEAARRAVLSPRQDRIPGARRKPGETCDPAPRAVLSPRQDRIVELWTRGWTVPDIAESLDLPVARVSDEKYKALRKLERHLAASRDTLDLDVEDRR